jgi:hypothetical protein
MDNPEIVETTEKTFCRTWLYLLNNPEKKAESYKKTANINSNRYKTDDEYKAKMVEYHRNYYQNNEAYREKKRLKAKERYLAKKAEKQKNELPSQ